MSDPARVPQTCHTSRTNAWERVAMLLLVFPV